MSNLWRRKSTASVPGSGRRLRGSTDGEARRGGITPYLTRCVSMAQLQQPEKDLEHPVESFTASDANRFVRRTLQANFDPSGCTDYPALLKLPITAINLTRPLPAADLPAWIGPYQPAPAWTTTSR